MSKSTDKQSASLVNEKAQTRRRLLAACGVAATVGVAGCLGNDDGNESEPDDSESDDDGNDENDSDTGDEDGAENEDGEDDDGASEQAQSSYDSAIDSLVANAVRFEELKTDEQEPTEAEVQTFSDRLNEARQSLNEAENGADEELEDKIAAARTIVSVQQELTEYYSIAVEYGNDVSTAFEDWENGEYGVAETEFGNAVVMVGDLRDQINAIEIALDSVDATPIEESSLEYTGEVWTYINPESNDEVDATEQYTLGLQQFARTLNLTVEGEELYRQERFGEAETRFADALDAGVDAESNFGEVRNDPAATDQVSELSDSFWQEVTGWNKGLELFEEAAQVAQTGDVERANSIYRDGLEELPE